MRFRIGRLRIQINFYKKNMDIRGTKLFEFIPVDTANSKGFILSGRFMHITVEKFDKEWHERNKLITTTSFTSKKS